MSLIRPVVRMCARAALLNKTWAEDRIFDSSNTPLSDMLEQDAAPYIALYTDEDNIPEVTGKDIYLAPRNLSLTLEIGVAKPVIIAGSSPQIEIPQTDEGLEFTVDIVQTQAIAALIGDSKNEWAELLRKIMLRIIRVPSMRGGSAQAGTRFAARHVVFVCDTIADSPPGVVPDENHPLRQFIAMAKATPAMAGAGVLLENLINETAKPDWRQVQEWLTLTKEGIRGIGLAPIIEEEEQDEIAPELEVVNLLDAVPLPPAIEASSPTINPATFVLSLASGYSDERDTKTGDIVQLMIDAVEVHDSLPLTAEEIAAGSIIMVGEILPDGEHMAYARVQRPSLGGQIMTPSFGPWSNAVAFVIAS